jgi:adenylate cyclase
VGNIGSEKRLDYTVIGDSVNLGARLCSKAEGRQILIGEGTYELVKDKIKTRFFGDIQVKGKEKPVKVYEVIY